MSMVFKVVNYDTHEVLFFSNNSDLRKYFVKVKGPHKDMAITEHNILYKHQLIGLLNNTFKIEPDELLSLDTYFKEYFEQILTKLKDLNYNQAQTAKRKDLTF